MTIPMRAVIGLPIALAMSTIATRAVAQIAPQLLAQGCTTLTDNQQTLTLTASASAAASVLLSVALNSTDASDLTVTDDVGNRYYVTGGYQYPAANLALVTLRAPLQRTLASGSSVTIDFGNASSTTQSCAAIYLVTGAGFSGQVLDTFGAAAGLTSTPGVSSNTSAIAVPEIVFAAVASNASPGTPDTPATVASNLCSSDNTLCLTGAYYFSSAGGPASTSFSASPQINWVGVESAIYDDDIFGNGFN